MRDLFNMQTCEIQPRIQTDAFDPIDLRDKHPELLISLMTG